MSIIYLNGEFVEDKGTLISHRDCGFTTGIGIFDSMLVQDGELVHGAEHHERIMHDVKTVIGLTLYMSHEKFDSICGELLETNKLSKNFARIRTTVTGGLVKGPLMVAHTPSILIDVAACQSPEKVEPVTCAVIDDFPRIAGCVLENCKRLDYSRSYAARRKAESLGATEAIVTNTDGNIACGATSNIFIEEDGVLITPPLRDGVLAGVTRRKIIEKKLSPLLNPPPFKGGRKEGRESAFRWGDVREESISPERLRAADKIFLTNSFIGLRPVKLIAQAA